MSLMIVLPFPNDNKIFAISGILFNLFLLIILFTVLKLTSEEFRKVTKGKIVATLLFFLLLVIPELLNLIKSGQGSNSLFLLVISIVLGLVAGILLDFVLVSSAITIYQTIKNKLFKKNKKDHIISWLLLIFGNWVSLGMLYFMFFLLTNNFLHPLLYQPCGIQITNLTNPSGARDAGMNINEVINNIEGRDIKTTDDLFQVLGRSKPNDIVTVKTDKSNYVVTLGFGPQDSSRSFLGVNVKPKYCDK